MKTITTVLFTLILLLTGNKLFGKENFKGDTIRIQMDGIMIELASCDLKVNTIKKAEIAEKLKFVLDELKNVEISQPKTNERVVIKIADKYSYGESIYKTIELEKQQLNKSEAVLFEGKKLLKGQSAFVLVMEDEDYSIKIFLHQIDDALKILEPDFNRQLLLADEQIPENRKLTNGWLIEDGKKEFNSYFLGETSHITSDMIELSGGIGSGLIKNTFVTDINAKVGFAFGKKAVIRNVYFTKYELMYDFSDGNSENPFQTNSFVSVGWEHNMSKDPAKGNWYGLSLGYLTQRNGDFFEKNTFKLGLMKRLNKTININSELYFNDKGVYPGVKVSFGF